MALAVVNPQFSIALATKNAAATLRRAITSIQRQRNVAVEVVVVDGASTDESVEILHGLCNEQPLVWISEPDDGIYDAWNKAVRLATGEWILFMGADDELAGPDVLAAVSRRLGSEPARVVYGRVVRVAADGRPREEVGLSWPTVEHLLWKTPPIPHQGTFHHMSLFEHQGFDTSFSIAGDYEFLLRTLSVEEPLFLDLTVTRMGDGGVSSQLRNAVLVQKEFLRALARHGHRPPVHAAGWRLTKAYSRMALGALLGEEFGPAIVRWTRRRNRVQGQ